MLFASYTISLSEAESTRVQTQACCRRATNTTREGEDIETSGSGYPISHLPPQVPECELAAPDVHLANCGSTCAKCLQCGETDRKHEHHDLRPMLTPFHVEMSSFSSLKSMSIRPHYCRSELPRTARQHQRVLDCCLDHGQAPYSRKDTDTITFSTMKLLTVQSHCWRYFGRWYPLNFLEYPFHLLQ